MRARSCSDNGIAGERPDDLDRHLGIGPPGEFRDVVRLEPRPGFRHVETAVAGEPRERHVDKTERRSLAAGGYITHCRPTGLTQPNTYEGHCARALLCGHGLSTSY